MCSSTQAGSAKSKSGIEMARHLATCRDSSRGEAIAEIKARVKLTSFKRPMMKEQRDRNATLKSDNLTQKY